MKLKIMTYNIASCRTYKLGPDFRPVTRDIERYAEAMKEFAPDVCGLNEVDYKLPRSCRVKMAQYLGDALGYESAFAPAVTWGLGTYGNGFISKYPIKDLEVYPIPDPPTKTEDTYYETRVILHAIVDIEGRDVDFFVTHFGLARAEAQSAADTLVELIKRCENPVVLMGDFNLRMNDPILAPLFELLQDTFTVYPDKDDYTYPSDPIITSVPEHYGKIDYIFLSKHFKVESVEIPALLLSDHKPYIAYAELLDEE